MPEGNHHSRFSGFYRLSLEDRYSALVERGYLDAGDVELISHFSGLDQDQAEHMIENVIGTYSLPFGVALNFVVNGKEPLIPMVIEEPSVVAGASFMARLARAGGGFTAQADRPVMIGQIQILDIQDLDQAAAVLESNEEELIYSIQNLDPILLELGGGPLSLEVRKILDSAVGPFLVVHLLVDVRDAMGANAVNTACEALAPKIEELTGGRAHLRILSNLADNRLVRASCRIPVDNLGFDEYSGQQVRDGVLEAWAFADADPYRAATHNKGIMNGIDAVLIATGNDWRAVEAGAHAYAARDGRYRSLSTWSRGPDGDLIGRLKMPLAVGIVGGATRVHPGARTALKMMGVESAAELAEITAAVGLAQNLAALRALATEGIQQGHMSLHARQIAIAAGAEGKQIPRLADQLVKEENIRIDRAREVLKSWSDLKDTNK
jgi:hydroxymethylglutaryl-CoA reductase